MLGLLTGDVYLREMLTLHWDGIRNYMEAEWLLTRLPLVYLMGCACHNTF